MKKRIIYSMVILAVSLIMFPAAVFAAADKSVSLKENGGRAEAEILIGDSEDEVTSLQLGFQIEVKEKTAAGLKAEFVFDESIRSAVKTYRYHEDTGILNIYISGTQNLFENDTLKLGSMTFTSDQPVKAEVSVIEDSLKTVNSGYGMEEETVNAPGTIEIAIGEDTPETPDSGSEGDTETPDSDEGQTDTETSDSDNGQTDTETPGSDEDQGGTETPGSDEDQGGTETPDSEQDGTQTPDSGGEQGGTEANGSDTQTPGNNGSGTGTPGSGDSQNTNETESLDGVKTGDTFRPAVVALISVFSLLCIAAAVIVKKKFINK